MKRNTLSLIAFIICTLSTNGQIAPYLQKPTAESIIVNWRSQTGTESKVYYGEDKVVLNQTASGIAELFSGSQDDNYSYVYHTVNIKGLKSNTIYYYQTENNSQKSNIYSFKTQPQL